MKRIPLSNGLFTVVDDIDYPHLSQYTWHVIKPKDRLYVVRNRQPRGSGSIYMHRSILKAKKGELVDHRDLDTLNNRRKNLRKCTYTQNGANKNARIDAPFGFKGVRKVGNRFRAYVGVNKKQIHCGYHDTLAEAAMAYDFMAKMCFGEFARTNFESEK